MPRDVGARYDKLLRTAFAQDDKEFFSNVVENMVLNYPEREKTIREAHESKQTVEPLRKLLQPHKCKVIEFPLGLADPEAAVSLPGRTGKVTPLFNALRPF